MTGILDISAEQYHRDEVADVPTLSASIAHTLESKSPKHAREEHPKLNANFERKAEEKFDVGNAAHSIVLDGRALDDVLYVVHEPTWQKKIAKEAREYARSIGKIPLLSHQRDDVVRMVIAVREQLAGHHANPAPFTDGTAEQTIVWEEPNGVFCRARLDWLHRDLSAIDDFKTSHNANPKKWEKGPLYDHGCDIQCCFYLRGIERLTGQRPAWRWIVVETKAPYALSVIEPGPDVLTLGEAKVERALETWRKCLASGEWPGYPQQIVRAEMPPWEEARFMEKEAREEVAA